ncbi:MAG TPA: redoxin domain-containing protein, partial [Anaerohalosphaeraceae bacterium]|nr:redoxin domain-containing protein [Anaerohalosphaeraceae bacterium]
MQTRYILFILVLLAVLLPLPACRRKAPAPQPADSNTPASVPAARIRPSAPVQRPDSQPAAAKGQIGADAAPLDGLVWLKGQPVRFQPQKVYVVEFWATWCGPCRQSIPHLTQLQKQFKEKGVTVIGISNESAETVRSFVKKMGDQMDYTVAVDKDGKAGKNYMEAYGQNGIPTAFIVDGAGKIVWLGHPLNGMDEVLAQVAAGTFDPSAWAKARAEREELERQIEELFRQYFSGLNSNQPSEQMRAIAG